MSIMWEYALAGPFTLLQENAMLELLAPAGSPEAVVAAVQNGADAVYLGLGAFNARRGAKNFTDEEFLDAVKYCHERGCKVYVTPTGSCPIWRSSPSLSRNPVRMPRWCRISAQRGSSAPSAPIFRCTPARR